MDSDLDDFIEAYSHMQKLVKKKFKGTRPFAASLGPTFAKEFGDWLATPTQIHMGISSESRAMLKALQGPNALTVWNIIQEKVKHDREKTEPQHL